MTSSNFLLQLVTRADDAGSSRSANRAIYETATMGIARNISLMACGPAIEDAAQVLCSLSHVDFGLHVTLNSEWNFPRWGPVSDDAKVLCLLESDGCFTHEPRHLFERGVDDVMLNAMLLEIRAQLARLRQLGFTISYLDEHMSVGWLPGLRDQLARLCAGEKLIHAHAIAYLPQHSGDFNNRVHNFIQQLSSVPAGDWAFVLHPAFDDEETRTIHGMGQSGIDIARERDADRQLYCDPEARDWCLRRNINFKRYSEVLS